MNTRFDPCGEGVREHFCTLAFPQPVPVASPADVRSLREALSGLLAEVVEDGKVCPELDHLPSTHQAVKYAQYVLAETRRFA